MPEPINPYMVEFPESIRIEVSRLGIQHNSRLVEALDYDLNQYPQLRGLIDTIPLIDKSALEIAKTFDQEDIDLILGMREIWVFMRWSDFSAWEECSREDIKWVILGKKLTKIKELFWDDAIFEEQKTIPFAGFLEILEISDEWISRIENLSQVWMVLTFEDFSLIEELSKYHYSLLLKLFTEKIVQNKTDSYNTFISLSKYKEMRIVDIICLLWIQDANSFSVIFWWMYALLDDFPDFRLFFSIKDSKSFFSSFKDYLDKEFPIKNIEPWGISPLIQRLFRIWDDRENVRQQSSNCFLVAWLYSLLRNPYFLSYLWENLTLSERNWFRSKWNYSFDDRSTYTIDSHDIRSDQRVPRVMWYDSQDLLDFGLWIKAEYDKKSSFYGISLPNWFWEILRRYFTKDWKPKKSFISKVSKEIEVSSGIFYTLWMEKERRSQSIWAIHWPIGYRILEASYNFHHRDRLWKKVIILWGLGRWAKELSNNWGKTIDVFQTFLPETDWKIYNSSLWEIWKVQLQHALRLLQTWQSIICMSIDTKENESPYFEIEWFKMAINHAYSVKSFDKSTWEIEIVNPWDSSQSKLFTIDTFLEIFDETIIALKK